eukprot:g12646.t1
MGRRGLSAIGVAAAAMMQCPADSFLGSTGVVRQPLVHRNNDSSPSGNRDINNDNNCSPPSPMFQRGRSSPLSRGVGGRARAGLRRPAAWRLTSVRGGVGGGGGGGGGTEEGAAAAAVRRCDASGTAGVKRSDAEPPRNPVATATPDARNGSGPTGEPQQHGGSSGGSSNSSRKQETFDIRERERAGFSLFRCDAYHCEREMVESGEISASAPSTTQVMMRWNERPRRALVLMKPDQDLLPLAAQTIDYLQRDMGIRVLVETAAEEAVGQALDEFTGGEADARAKLEVFTPPERSVVAEMGPRGGAGPAPPLDGDSVDFVLTLGGDGLLMYSNTLFRRSVPPHLCFNLGSMGFLSPFEYEAMKEEVRRIMSGGMKVSLRMRLSARIIRDDQTSEAFHALNEIVIDRGSSPYLTNLECYCDEEHLTTVQADGLIIATPTGSTAYSMSAGGSMVHPCVPAILFTPICPHSLSFRPIVFPDTVMLRLCMPQEARAEARVSFDGKLSQPLRRGDTLVIKTSNFPVPTICKDDSTADWFASLDQALGFNTRMKQREFKPLSTMTEISRGKRNRNDDRFDE